jgi:hypothetical protein
MSKEKLSRDDQAIKIRKYLEFCHDERIFPKLEDYLPFEILIEDKRIGPFYTSIRIMYSDLCDTHYYINEDFKLIEEGKENSPALDPKEILNIKACPRGWEALKLINPHTG